MSVFVNLTMSHRFSVCSRIVNIPVKETVWKAIENNWTLSKVLRDKTVIKIIRLL